MILDDLETFLAVLKENTLSKGIQEAIVRAVDEDGWTQEQTAQAYYTTKQTVSNICFYHEIFRVVPVVNAFVDDDKIPGGLNQFHLAFLADLMESDPRLYLHEYIIKFEEEFNLATPCMVESTMFQILEYLDSTCKVMYRENPQANLGQEMAPCDALSDCMG